MSTADILRQEGQQEGQLLAQQQAVVEALEIRFNQVSDELREEMVTSLIPHACMPFTV